MSTLDSFPFSRFLSCTRFSKCQSRDSTQTSQVKLAPVPNLFTTPFTKRGRDETPQSGQPAERNKNPRLKCTHSHKSTAEFKGKGWSFDTGHGFEIRSGLNFFIQALIWQLQKTNEYRAGNKSRLFAASSNSNNSKYLSTTNDGVSAIVFNLCIRNNVVVVSRIICTSHRLRKISLRRKPTNTLLHG